jgi:hypothetical protein
MFEYIRQRSARFEDVWTGWSWRLARNPFLDATPVPGTTPQIYLIKTPPFQLRDLEYYLTFKYSITDEVVDLLAVRLSGKQP